MRAFQPIARRTHPAMKPARLPAIILVLACGHARAQTPPPPSARPEFEAVSIHLVEPHSPEDLDRGIGLASLNSWPTNRYFAHNISLAIVVSAAYRVAMNHIAGGPDWLNSQLYSIDAKVDGDRQLSLDEIRPLLQNLLEQRFHLTAHHESRIVSGFVLVVAKGGPKLQPAKEGAHPPYGQMLPNQLQGWDWTASDLASFLSLPVGQPVIDKTGLTGSYDIKLPYATANDPNSSLPDLFTAVQEQLGLKLQPEKVPVDFLVIDHADKIPTEN